MTARTRRTRNDPPKLVLTREPGNLRIAGRDANGEVWMGLDATGVTMTCARCGGRIQYGYIPRAGGVKRAHCNRCVEFVDEQIG